MQALTSSVAAVRVSAPAARAAAKAPAPMQLKPTRAAMRSAFAGSAAPLRAAVSAVESTGVRSETVCKASPVAVSYAVALAESAQASNTLDQIHADVETFSAYSLSNTGIASVLANPVLSDAKKQDLVAKIAKEGSFSPVFVSFLNLLIKKRRINLINQVLVEFEAIYCKLSDTQVATVTSAVKLENEQQFAIAKKLQEMTGAKNIKLKPVVDAGLIGGFVVQFGKDGSGMIDLSVKGQMAKLAAELTA